jgi:hypothetical protein
MIDTQQQYINLNINNYVLALFHCQCHDIIQCVSQHKFASANRGDGEIILTDGQIHLVFSGSLLWSQSAKGNDRFLLPNIVKRVHQGMS